MMPEQKPNEPEPTPPAEPEKPNMIMDAHSAAEKLKAENERMEKNIKQLQDLRAEQILSGSSNAGQSEPKKEMTDTEYKDYILKHGRAPEE